MLAPTEFSVVGEAGDAASAYAIVTSVKPDVVTMDVSLPGATGITATREILRLSPTCKILIISMHTNEDYVAQALAAGAKGFAGKDQPSTEIIAAIRAVASGHTYLSPRVSGQVVNDYLKLRDGRVAASLGPLDALSTREKEVFEMLVGGFSNDGIAAHLCISVRTVETHRTRILKKLHVHSVVELLRFAARHGLIRD